jgi:hypothetical protein
MKKLLITAATVAVLVVPSMAQVAQATEMPRSLYGAWCHLSDNGAGEGTLPNGFNLKTETLYRTRGHDRSDIKCRNESETYGYTVISKKGWEGWEAGCNVAKVTPMGTEGSRPVYEIIFKNCGGGADTWDEAWRVYVDKEGLLHLRQKITRYSGGLDSLNRISAWISGTSAGIRLRRGGATW